MTFLLDPYGDQWSESPSGLVLPASAAPAPKPTAVDLFCGCGGFSLGIIEAGFRVLCGVDNDACATETYLVNLGTYPVDLRFVEPGDRDRLERHLSRRVKRDGITRFETSGSNRTDRDGVPVFWFGDIAKLSGARILESIGLARGELDLVVGGPPCQGFSKAGKRDVVDPRNNGVFEFARLVCEIQPKALAMENVPGMLSMTTPEGASVVDELCAILERGDFAEFEAMRRLLTGGDVRSVRRGATCTRKKKRSVRTPSPAPEAQRTLFEESGQS